MISKKHSNRKAYNWLAYDAGDHLLKGYTHLYKGDLYDLGCGERPYEEFFLEHCEAYTGVDWSSSIHTLKADVVADLNEKLPLEDEVANTVVTLSVMEHLREPQVMLNEAFRIMKPEGYIILQVPFMWQVHEAPYDFFRYTRYGLEYLFEKAGFIDVKVEATSGFWVMWFLKLNYQLARLVRGPKWLQVIVNAILTPFWWLDQHFAHILDKIWPNSEGETAGYCVTARKP